MADVLMGDLRRIAVDTGVRDAGIASGPGTPYLVGPFEDGVTELGWRVFAAEIDENDWQMAERGDG